MLRYVIVSLVSGLGFGILDGLINANPLAAKLFAVYKPIAREKIPVSAGFAIDFAYGFAMAGIFRLLFRSLPGDSGLLKGLSYGAVIWFFRVVMQTLSNWMMFRIGAPAVFYSLAAGLAEMVAIGAFYGCAL
jgi:hypothetical protein